ncbi:MAG: site-specific integrase [Lachnospiraceae bacterium]|nr:site-specific integrase [Lachnospiraceae bacterium]
MGKVKDEILFTLIKNFMTVYLPERRQASPNTIKSYRTAWNQLLDFVAEEKKISVLAVSLKHLDREMVELFLSKSVGKNDGTYNNRLAAIKSFFAYASACNPEYISRYNEIAVIKSRKQDVFAKVDYMTEEAVKTIMETPDTKTETGVRDQFFMVLMYDTGARIQEMLSIKVCDIKLGRTATVVLHGKGNKTRIVPLMSKTISHLNRYLHLFHPRESEYSAELLFYTIRNGVKGPICDDTMRIRIQKYADEARKKCPEIPEKVHPHLWRHSRAMHLYQHGMELTLISQWLGHKQLTTTLVYAHADTEIKRKAIEHAMEETKVSIDIDTKYKVDDEATIRHLYGL